MAEVDSRYSLTALVQMTFPALFQPRKFKGPNGKETGEEKYSANFLFDPKHPDLKPLKELAAKVAKAKWPGRDWKANPIKFAFADGTKLAEKRCAQGKKDDGTTVGKVVLSARSKFPPALSGIENGKITDYEGDAKERAKNKFYSGVLVLATFNFVAYDGVGANPDGVTAYLDMVFTRKRGERIGSARSAAEAFKGYAGSITDEDPTGG